ncbi:Phosphoenolpyruvate/pyruvate domain-containing protein [Xylaria sp. CBS 124048]|nr:Phosphoenolpyruvate/pyruvate domain-containing protein [Xylaria sp. CBS 124048]
MTMSTLNAAAKALKTLHQRSKTPLVLANVWDVLTARTIGELPTCEALATTSYSLAQAAGINDDELTLETNLAGVGAIAAVAASLDKPLTVDIQDGYGAQLEEAIGALIDLGVAGANLEDSKPTTGELYDADEAAARIGRALVVAKQKGVPDFVINARCDVLAIGGGGLEEVLTRGRKYLAAGATTVFVWGYKRGVSRDEVVRMVEAFDGRLAVMAKMTPDGLSVRDLADMGVSRISVGPSLMWVVQNTLRETANKWLVY